MIQLYLNMDKKKDINLICCHIVLANKLIVESEYLVSSSNNVSILYIDLFGLLFSQSKGSSCCTL